MVKKSRTKPKLTKKEQKVRDILDGTCPILDEEVAGPVLESIRILTSIADPDAKFSPDLFDGITACRDMATGEIPVDEDALEGTVESLRKARWHIDQEIAGLEKARNRLDHELVALNKAVDIQRDIEEQEDIDY